MQSAEPMQQLCSVQEEGGVRLRRGATASTISTTLNPTRPPPHSFTVCPDIKWQCSCGAASLCHSNLCRIIGECHSGACFAFDRAHPSLCS